MQFHFRTLSAMPAVGSVVRGMWGLVALLALLTGGRAPAAEREGLAAALESIQADELQRHVDVLADDSFEGRKGGSRGGRAAGGYLVERLAAYGMQPLGEDGGYYQPFGAGMRNVLALLPGSDEELRHEVVVISAHYDHVGYGTPRNSFGPIGYIHNGADDNASGVSALLEVIEACTRLPSPPQRSLAFAFWDGEEDGLLGSQHWLAHPTLPRESIVAAVNMDMVGRLRRDRVEIYGSRTGWGLRSLLSRANAGTDLTLDFSWEMRADSDHHSFFQKGIPVVMLHTGLHESYHRPQDDAHTLNAEGMQRVARLAFQTALALAEEGQPRGFRAAARQEGPAQRQRFEQALPPAPPRLGVLAQRDPSGPGLTVARVDAGSPAEQAGLLVGDRLLELNGAPLVEEESFRALIARAPAESRLLVERPGLDGPREAAVTLAGSPVRLGVSWRDDDAEPGTLLVTRVIHGSPAERAGLQAGDRLLEAGGAPIAGSESFAQWAQTASPPFELLVEQQGRLRAVRVE